MPTGAVDETTTGSDAQTPDLDVWAWTSKSKPSLDELLEVKHAVLSHPALRTALDGKLTELGDDEKQPEAAGIARWMLAQYRRAYPLLKELRAPAPAVQFAKAECCLKGEVADGTDRPMRRPDLSVKHLRKHPDAGKDARIDSLLLHALLFDNEIDELKKALNGASKEVKDGADGLYFMGRIAQHEGDYETAETHYLKAIELDPQHRSSLFQLAYQYDLGGDDEQAMDYYRRLMELRPLDSHALLNYGVLLEDHGRYEEAARCYRMVLAVNPQHRRAQTYLRDAQASLDMIFDEDIERRHDKRNRLLRIPISDFELSVRARNCLSKMNIETLGDLVIKTEPELLAYKNFGETSLNEIKVLLESKGLRLGMNLNEDPIPEPGEEPPPAPRPAQPIKVPPGVDPAVLNVVLADLELSVRCRKALAQVKAVTIGDLLQHSESELLSIKNFGQTSLNELKMRLAEHGLETWPT